MIIGITGAICAGKRAFAEYLAKKYGFDLIDMLDLFRKELRKQGLAIAKECSPVKGSRKRDEDEEHRENGEEEKSSFMVNPETSSSASRASELTLESSQHSTHSDEESFMFQYYQCKQRIFF